MNLREALGLEHSKSNSLRIAAFIGADPERFALLMREFLGSDYRITQRAAWVLAFVVEKNPRLIEPYLSKLVNLLAEMGLHDAVKRNVLRILQDIEIPKRLHGKLYSHCVDLIGDLNEPAAVRAFALTVAARIAKNEPALQHELHVIVTTILPYASAAVHVRAREVLKWQNEING
jgi:hypothetical protein